MKHLSNVMKAIRIPKVLSSLVLLAAFGSSSRCATTAFSTRNADGPVKVFELGLGRLAGDLVVVDEGVKDVGCQ
jgi:hypothetical protein